jgi:hypothetical protein
LAKSFQITLNNLTVGRSVLEALRLLEAFQAVAKHGVLCPIDWKPSDNAQDTLNTIANTLTESYDERLANLQKEFDGMQVTDLDAKHKGATDTGEASFNDKTQQSEGPSKDSRLRPTDGLVRSHSSPQLPAIQEIACEHPKQSSSLHGHRNDCLPHTRSALELSHSDSFGSDSPSTAPASANNTPMPTPQLPQTAERQQTARRARGTMPYTYLDQRYVNSLFSQSAPSIFHAFNRHIFQDSDSDSDTD